MPGELPSSAGPVGERPVEPPRPFSNAWLQLPPELRSPPPRRAPALPDWFPADHTISAILVMLLVLSSLAIGRGPSLHSTLGAATPTGTAETIAGLPATGTAIVDPLAPTAAVPPRATSLTETLPSATATTASVAPDPRAILPAYRVVTYYGHPADANMGILGELEMEDLLVQLLDEAQAYERADPTRPVMPAFELIASVAQGEVTADGTWLLYTDAPTIQKYVEFARANNLLLILDLQIGYSTIEDEIDGIRQWLTEPFVHVALDAEFAMTNGGVPAVQFGSLDASHIAVAQQILSEIVIANNLPPKLLIVHRLTENMVTNAEEVVPVTGVQTVIDFDGHGTPESKIEGYNLFSQPTVAEFAAIKLFYKRDDRLMQPVDIVALDRPPDVVIYQ